MTARPDTPLSGILLVSCYELGRQPLGLAVPAGVLERAGIAPALMDVAVEPFNEAKAANASLIGISVPMHTALRLGVRVARRVRDVNPTAHICFYGLYAELNAEHLRAYGADTCLGGEFEAGLLELCRRVLDAPAGVAPRDVRLDSPPDPRRTRSLNLTPSRRGLDAHRGYVRLDDGVRLRDVGAVATTRGCKHTCRHCPLTPVYGGSFYAIAVDSVMADVEALVASGATHITFADPDFLNGPGHARRVARALSAAFPGVTFDYTAKIEHLARHRALVEEFQGLGSLFVVSALESLCDVVLAHLDKGHTRADALSVIRHFRAIGLVLRPSLLAFTPWETLDSFVDLLDTLESEGIVDQIDPVQFSIRLLVPPGSPLLDSPSMQPHLGPLDAERFSYAWRHPDPRMDRLQSEIARIVERAADTGEDATCTFDSVKAAARAELDGGAPVEGVNAPRAALTARARTPRLTEAWFC